MITVLGAALVAVFLLVPLCVAGMLGIGIGGCVVSAFVKMLLRVGLSGAVVYFLLQAGSVCMSLLAAIVLVVYYSATVCVKARLGLRQFVVPVLSGMSVAILLSGSLLLFANVSVGSDFGVRYVLPVVALLSGGVAEPVGRALTVYYMGLRHHNHLYYYLIGNGATRAEAMRYLQRRAVEQAVVSGVKTMSAVGAGVSPVMMWTMLMCGRSAVESVCWQILVVTGGMVSSVVAVCVSVAVARRYVLDGYARIKVAADMPETKETLVNEKNDYTNE